MNNPLQAIQYANKFFEQSDIFYGHGTDNALDEAYALVIDVLNLSHDMSDEALAAIPLENPEELITLIHQRVNAHVPVPYLTHKAWFCGLPFYVDERVLIPRSPLAEVICNYFEPWIDPETVTDVLDLCTGSGCIAIACAYAFENANIDAVDLSQDALDVARINVEQHNLTNQVHLLQGDLFHPVKHKQYDIIVSNPPYVGQEEMQSLPEEFEHEPTMALVSGDLGLDIVDQILKQAARHLKDNGILIVEVGNTWQIMEEHYPNLPFVWLEFEMGGEGVFMLNKEDLLNVW
ncbi:MAG: 50S ribosomal protein L3 N(5)-glutamine methyltransferase [Pseudomonadota bacterium]